MKAGRRKREAGEIGVERVRIDRLRGRKGGRDLGRKRW